MGPPVTPTVQEVAHLASSGYPVPVCTCENTRVPCFTCGGHVSAWGNLCTCAYKCSFEVISCIPTCLCNGEHYCHLCTWVCICMCANVPGWVCLCACDRASVCLYMSSCPLHVCAWTSACRHVHVNFCKSTTKVCIYMGVHLWSLGVYTSAQGRAGACMCVHAGGMWM